MNDDEQPEDFDFERRDEFDYDAWQYEFYYDPSRGGPDAVET